MIDPVPHPTPLLSIILPVRNGLKFIPSVFASLSRQTDARFELVMVDDHSTDDSLACALSLAHSFEFTGLSLEGRSGVAAARNLGIEAARGDYLWFVDVDDTWSDEFVERMLSPLIEFDLDLAVCSASLVDDAGGNRPFTRRRKGGRCYGNSAKKTLLMDIGSLWNKVIRKSLMGCQEGFFLPLRSKSDHAGVARLVPLVGSVIVVRESLYTYHRRSGSISNGGVTEPGNFLLAADYVGELQGNDEYLPLSAAITRFKYDCYARAIRELWRFGARVKDGDELYCELRRRCRLRDSLRVSRLDPMAAITCASAILFPRLSSRIGRNVGKGFWSA